MHDRHTSPNQEADGRLAPPQLVNAYAHRADRDDAEGTLALLAKDPTSGAPHIDAE